MVHDPKALTNARLRYPTLTYADSAAAALTGADVVLLLTEWDEYRRLDPIATAELTAGRAIFDGRNVLDRDSLEGRRLDIRRGRPRLVRRRLLA